MTKSNLKLIGRASALALVASLATSGAQADDELLDILGAGGSQPKAQGQKADESLMRRALLKSMGKLSAEQNIFVSFIDQNQFDKALYQWPSAFEGTSFAKSPTGRALNAFVLFKNGIQVTALEQLLMIDRPKEVDSYLQQAWREMAPDNAPVWAAINPSVWHQGWTDVFGIGAEVRVRGRQVYAATDAEQVRELIKKTQVDTRERAWLSWQLVIALAQGEDAGTAGKALALLMKAPNNPVSEDLMTMTAARLLFQNGFLDAAIKYYQRIGKKSDYWFDAQEEMAWAFIRKGEPQNSIAITKTLVAPNFAAEVGPETFFLRSLSQLKVCDYPSVVETLNSFRNRFKPRVATLKELTERADTEQVKRTVQKMKSGSVKLTDLGADAHKLPRYTTRDQVLLQNVMTEKALEKEAQIAGTLYARSLEGGTGQVGFQARLEDFKKAVEARAQAARSATYARIKALAEEEITEVTGMLQKLHIVEAELLQQISIADRVIGATKGTSSVKSGTTGSQAKDTVWFPAESETWFDEYANYKVDIKKGCAAAGRSGATTKQ
ncbi:MAG TPA: hypothetical protein PLZ57_13065 [Pseudobdellovibrionaceae bacterium]|nr:hypothetical protein [Pseudobdellovibrionaceae bacterium]